MWFKRCLLIFNLFLFKFGRAQDFEETYSSEEITTPYRPTFEDSVTTVPENDFEESSVFISEELATTETLLAEGEKKISETILEMMEHFKKPNPEGIPGIQIPDPYGVPDMKKSVTYFDSLYLENIYVYGLSKIKVEYVTANFEDMEVNAAMKIDELQTRGTYRYSSFLMPGKGPFTVNVTGLKITPRGTLGVEVDGKLKTEDINIDISFDNIAVNFENLGSLGSILQGLINTMGPFIFENIKPQLLQDAYTKAREEINKKIEEIAGDVKFPNSIAPLDMVLIDARIKIREMGYDPYKLQDYHSTDMSYVTLSSTNAWLKGLSSFYRIGNVTSSLENNTVIANFQIGSQKLEGFTTWDISTSLVSVTGTASFSIEYISVGAIIAQCLDTRQRPVLHDINLDIGNIQVRCDGAGTIDYIIEFVINILPNLLRYQVVAALEGPLKTKLQEELNGVDVEEEIKMALPRIDELAETGFKLSFLRGEKESTYDEDEFFNF